MISRRERGLFVLIALFGALLVTRGLVNGPGFTDVFYHLNAANRLVTGQGLTDDYLWTYIGAPEQLPAPSHLYWMPLTSLTAALGMGLTNSPGSYAAAQWPFTLMFAAIICVGFTLGERLGGSRRHAWVAGLVTLFSGYFTRFWGAIDTFAPYALVGALALLFLGLALQRQMSANPQRPWKYWALGGVMAALAHLTRADGVLLLVVGWSIIVWTFLFQRAYRLWKALLFGGCLMTVAYFVTMLPWFIRNLNVIGIPMPLGGTQTIWLTTYDDLFRFPPDNSPASLFADGLGLFLASRWEALTNNLGTFIAVEGLIIMTPLMLVGLWRRRRDDFLRPFWIYVVGLHLAMTVVFPFPGYRGGLLHSTAALVPFWAALGVVGLDDCVDWIARRRRNWNPRIAKGFFSVGLVLIAAALSWVIGTANRVGEQVPSAFHQELMQLVEPGTRVMINDPAQLYYFTGRGGVVLPNETPDVIPQIARLYGVRYLVLEGVSADGQSSSAAPELLWPILTDLPDFLIPLSFSDSSVRLYEIRD